MTRIGSSQSAALPRCQDRSIIPLDRGCAGRASSAVFRYRNSPYGTSNDDNSCDDTKGDGEGGSRLDAFLQHMIVKRRHFELLFCQNLHCTIEESFPYLS